MWILLLVFHHGIPTSSIAEAVYEMHVDIFLIRKHVRYFDYDDIVTRHSHTSLDNMQAGSWSSYSSSSFLQ
jgi:hypothetical protein